MGKLKKDVIDEIRRLGEEGYTIAEIVEIVDAGRDSVRKYLDGVLEETREPRLSDGVMKRLYDLQGVLSADSVLDALETAYRDEVAAVKFKLSLWGEYASEDDKFTVEALIWNLKEYIEELESELKVYMDGYPEDQETIAELKEVSQGRYDEGHEAGYEDGKREHALYVKCAHCGRPILIEPMGAVHATVTKLLWEVGWGHVSCINHAQYESERGDRALRAEIMR